MYYKIYISIILLLFLLISCSNKDITNIDFNMSQAEKEEMMLQKTLLINEMAQSSIKLHKITWPILIKNSAECKKNQNKSYGLLFADINDIPKEDIKIYKKLFNNNISKEYFKIYEVLGFPIILSVANSSPAKRVGLEENDIVLEIENKNTINFREKLKLALNSNSELNLKILRNNTVINKKITGVDSCSYNVQPLPSGSPNAYADGKKVFITLAAIKLARTNDELAFLIGHEIAHNIYHYKNFNANEAELLAIDYLDKPKIRDIKGVFIWSTEDKEIEADIEGLRLAFNAGYALKNVNDYWRRLSIFNPELISKSISIYKSNAYRAALITSTLIKLRADQIERK